MTAQATVILDRPVGQQEFELIPESNWKRFPPHLEWQPLFYPVVTAQYAIRIARDWNTRDPNSGYVGDVLRFQVLRDYIDRHEPHAAGGRDLVEYWIPSEELDEFNAHIVGEIEVLHEFRTNAKPDEPGA